MLSSQIYQMCCSTKKCLSFLYSFLAVCQFMAGLTLAICGVENWRFASRFYWMMHGLWGGLAVMLGASQNLIWLVISDKTVKNNFFPSKSWFLGNYSNFSVAACDFIIYDKFLAKENLVNIVLWIFLINWKKFELDKV